MGATRQILAALGLIWLVAGCGQQPADGAATAAQREDSGLVTALAVTAYYVGAPSGTFYEFYPIDVTVTIKPTVPTVVVDQSVYVGLVEKVASDSHATARTCLLGALRASYGGQSTEPVPFENEFILGRDCLQGGGPGTFNVWVSVNPAVSAEANADVIEADVNTQFFNTEEIDSDGTDRNKLCIGPDGRAGCVIDVPLASAKGVHDVRMLSDVSSSSIAALPADCSIDPTLPLADLHVQVMIYGSDPHSGQVHGEKAVNAIAIASGAGGSLEEYHYSICPRGFPDVTGAFGCATGTTYAPLQVRVDGGLVPFATDDELVAGRPDDYHHQVFAPTGTDACTRITHGPGATEDWSGHSTFNVRACAVSPFAEMNSGSSATTANNNCIVTPVRLVISQPSGTSHANTARFDADYSSGGGDGSVIGVSASFYTHNDADLSGVTSDTKARASITGWFGFSLFSVWATGAANTAIDGSYVNAGAELLGQTYYSYSASLPSVQWSHDLTFAKSVDWYYNYGVAGIGLDVDAGVTGTVGLTGSLNVVAQSGAGPAPFDNATVAGSVVAAVTPNVSLSLNATATVNLGIAKGEVDGQLTMLSVQLPATATLAWGLTSAPALLLTAQSSLDLTLATLSGDLHGSVELLKPSWCRSRRDRIGYPCAKWSTVWDADIVGFNGIATTATLFRQAPVQMMLQ